MNLPYEPVFAHSSLDGRTLLTALSRLGAEMELRIGAVVVVEDIDRLFQAGSTPGRRCPGTARRPGQRGEGPDGLEEKLIRPAGGHWRGREPSHDWIGDRGRLEPCDARGQRKYDRRLFPRIASGDPMRQFSIEHLDQQAKGLVDDAHRFASQHELLVDGNPYCYAALLFVGFQHHLDMPDSLLHRIALSSNWLHVWHEIRDIQSMLDGIPDDGERAEAVNQVLNEHSIPQLRQVTTISLFHGITSDMDGSEEGAVD